MLWLASRRTAALDGIMRVVAHIGDFGGLWVAALVVMFVRRPWREFAVRYGCGLGVAAITANLLLKLPIARPRPFSVLPQLIPLIKPPTDFSFPSGHTSLAFAAAYGLAHAFGAKVGVPAFAVASVIAVSRVYVGVHFPSDVAAGVVVGLLCGAVGWVLGGVLIDNVISRFVILRNVFYGVAK
ncbi:MAG: phosphatase PAP2 family protein [Oscillospiraceae bacterium]|jgi:undecaprenyl-diphosphatase|nr:phosphatase PAP2 family protein [Oscillospiraceae bacterium]